MDGFIRAIMSRRPIRYYVFRPSDLLALYALSPLITLPEILTVPVLLPIILVLILVGRLTHLKQLLTLLKVKPTQLFLLAFLFTIFIGSILLCLPASTTQPETLSYIDALFTSFSAVCVTGLTVNTIGDTFTLFGQCIILILMQIGGLGIMTFSVLLVVLLQRKVSVAASQEYQESYATLTLGETVQAIGFILKFTILFEITGMCLLFISWLPTFESVPQTLYLAQIGRAHV